MKHKSTYNKRFFWDLVYAYRPIIIELFNLDVKEEKMAKILIEKYGVSDVYVYKVIKEVKKDFKFED